MEVLLLYLTGIILGVGIIQLVNTSCDECNQIICDNIQDEVAPTAPGWFVNTVMCLGVVFIICLAIFWFWHWQKEKKSKTYQAMVRSAEDHHVQCHAAIPNDSYNNNFEETWRAYPLSAKDVVRVTRLQVFSLNIVGVGFPLYCNAMLNFLKLCILFWLGNGVSSGLFHDVIQTACLPFDHRKGVQKAAEDLAVDRAWALLRLFIVTTVFHWLHAKQQRVFAREFDDKHMEMRDYALLVDGFPEDATSEKALADYLQEALKMDGRDFPKVVGTSIAFDFSSESDFVFSLLEEEFVKLTAANEAGQHKDHEDASLTSLVHEVHAAWEESHRGASRLHLPGARDPFDVDFTGVECSSSEESSSSWTHVDESDEAACAMEQDTAEIAAKLKQFKNSGRVFAVFEYPVNDKVSAKHLQEALDRMPFKGQHMEVRLLSADPPSIIWEHCVHRLKERQRRWGCLWLSFRDISLLLANLKIVCCCLLLVLGYYYIYSQVYRAQKKAKQEDFMMTTLVTVSASVGNIIINQIVWSCAMDVGYRFKADRDAYVFRWYTVITLINTIFNFGVITTTFSKKPEDDLQQVLYEAALGHQLFMFIRGSLISYAIFPVFYILLWLKGRVILLYHYLTSSQRAVGRLRFQAEQAMEPPEWWLQYDYAAIVVMMTTSTFCLFVHGSSAWYVFTLDVAWALAMVFINQYVYLALSRETYFSTDRLDAVASRAQGVPVAMIAVCILHWANRSERKRLRFALTVVVVVVSFIFVCLLESETRIHERYDKRTHVWYEEKHYKQAEEAIVFNWWNVNPVYCLRHKFGLLQDSPSRRRTTPWRAGKGHLQPRERATAS
ncbi:unnamed protein product [Effrenium voratum]|uniref:Uncharacterized protein n=1 Tax=Effrenium voratum TaxID=2562239 RepID=A0AA36MGP9_9DINO|nr:unnamed protein product [Effrenium voratum]